MPAARLVRPVLVYQSHDSCCCPAPVKLVVFFSRGMSLEQWHQAGILHRELAVYRRLSDVVDHLAVVTYGGAAELKWSSSLPGVEILSNKWGIAPNLYSLIAPWLHRRSLRSAAVFRTNQINGGWCAVVAKILFKKTLVVRCGFLWSDAVARLEAPRWRQAAARHIERFVLRSADRVVVAGEADAATISRRYGIERGAITVVPNFVDTSIFRPLREVMRESKQVVFVGRLEPEKNVEALLDALRGLPGFALTVVGDGSLRTALEEKARENGVTAEFVGRLPHSALPAILNRAGVFVLPSHYEANPKAIVEAMACGVPVIGTRVPGIRNVIRHRENGILCGTSAAEIRAALLDLVGDGALCERLSEAGRRDIRERYSLDVAVAQERALLASVSLP